MKQLTTLLAIFISSIAFSQYFELDGIPKKIYSNYNGYTLPMATIDNKYVVHGADEMEITEISTGKIVFEWDPKGSYGTSYVSKDGRWIANRSQNYDDPDLGYVDVYQVINTSTKKEYLKTIPDDLWSTTGFANTKSELAVQTYNFDDHKARLQIYDFVNDKITKTLYTSEKSSTVILGIAYSENDKYIYATIATNSSVSTLYVYDANSGQQVGKTSLIHQADKIFVTPESIIVSGAHGIKATDHTTVISAKDYTIKKEWKDVRIDNLDPSNSYSIIYNWDTKLLQTFDIKTGAKKDILDGKDMSLYPISCAFTKDGNYFAIAKTNSFDYKKTKGPGEFDVLYVLNNKLINDPVQEVTQVEETTSENVSSPTSTANGWVNYTLSNPKLDIKLPGEATVKEDKTSKGARTVTITGATKTETGVVSLVEIPNIKTSKYTSTAEKLGESYFKNKTPENLKKSTYSYRGQEGLEYTFKLGSFEYVYRVFCINGYAFQLFYLASDIGNSDYKTFFDSFDLK